MDALCAEAAIEVAMQMLRRASRTERIRRTSNLLPGVLVASCADADEGREPQSLLQQQAPLQLQQLHQLWSPH